MKELIRKYLRYLKIERNASEHTILSYENDLNQFLDFASEYHQTVVDDYPVGVADRLTIRLWLGSLTEDGMARSTIARKVASIRSFFKYCYKRGYIEKNPAHLLIVPKTKKRLPHTVHVEEIHRMMELAPEDSATGMQDRAIMELFYSTGIRLSELTNLKPTDVDFSQNQVIVTGKGNKQRVVPLGKKAVKALKIHLQNRKKLSPLLEARQALFIAPKGGAMYARQVQRIIKRYFEKVTEVTQKSPHTLRHSFATHMLDSGADIRLIKEFLGHSNLASTQVYTHTSVEHLKNVYSKAHPRAEL